MRTSIQARSATQSAPLTSPAYRCWRGARGAGGSSPNATRAAPSSRAAGWRDTRPSGCRTHRGPARLPPAPAARPDQASGARLRAGHISAAARRVLPGKVPPRRRYRHRAATRRVERDRKDRAAIPAWASGSWWQAESGTEAVARAWTARARHQSRGAITTSARVPRSAARPASAPARPRQRPPPSASPCDSPRHASVPELVRRDRLLDMGERLLATLMPGPAKRADKGERHKNEAERHRAAPPGWFAKAVGTSDFHNLRVGPPE
jgi:hypothetical protein